MLSCKACLTPCRPHTQFLKNDGEPMSDPTLFQSLVGALQYLTFTRPDIVFVVNYACQFMSNPSKLHFTLVKMILHYLQGIVECGLTYFDAHNMELVAFGDANWASDINTRHSMTGFVNFLGPNPMSWQSKK